MIQTQIRWLEKELTTSPSAAIPTAIHCGRLSFSWKKSTPSTTLNNGFMKYPRLESTTAWLSTAQMNTNQLMLMSTAAKAANASRFLLLNVCRISPHWLSRLMHSTKVSRDHTIRWPMISTGSLTFLRSLQYSGNMPQRTNAARACK